MNKSLIQVVKVIDEYNIAINKGSKNCIEEGQRFLVYSLDSESIIDPISGENLGKLEIVKGTGIVSHVQECLATITSDSYTKPSKKVTKSRNMFNLNNELTEETINESQKIPFDNPQVGDFVKIIK